MKEIMRIVLFVINIATFVVVMLFGLSGVVYELLGPADYNKMLAKLKIPWCFNSIWSFVFVCFIISLITYLLRRKFF